MTDIVERLLAGTGGGKHWMDLHEEAAAEIKRLREALEAISHFMPTTTVADGGAAKHSANVRAADMVRAALADIRRVDQTTQGVGYGCNPRA